MRSTKYFSAVFFFLFLLSCGKVPITGRNQMNLLPESDLITMGKQQYSEVLSKSKIITGTPDATMVQTVGKKISDAVTSYLKSQGMLDRIAGYQWQYTLIESKEVNAWCLPGGKIAVYSGILPITQSEAGLAVVLGHEISHAVARHGNERMSQALLAQMGGVALSVAVANKPAETQNIFNNAYGLGAQVGVLLPFSRTQESEADKLGLVFMAIAGYDPNEAIKLWERMKAQGSGASVPAFVSTHPSDQERIDNLKAYLPEALKYYHPK